MTSFVEGHLQVLLAVAVLPSADIMEGMAT